MLIEDHYCPLFLQEFILRKELEKSSGQYGEHDQCSVYNSTKLRPASSPIVQYSVWVRVVMGHLYSELHVVI